MCNDSIRVAFKKNIVFFELGGKGPYYSINYERIFRQGQKLTYSYRAGFSKVTDGISAPLALSVFTSPGKHHLEVSLGLTPYIDKYRTFLYNVDLSDKYLYITSGIGYRYQKPGGKLYFATGFAPLIFMDPPSYDVFDVHPKFIPSASLGLGISF